MPVETLATPEELRVWLQLEADDVAALPDDRATQALEGPTRAVLRYCNRETLLSVEATVRVDGSGGHELVLPGAPVTAVDAVVEDPDDTAVDVTSYVDWSEHGILT